MRIDNRFGFVRVGTAAPVLQVANTEFNADQIIDVIKDAKKKRVEVLLFPELAITSYTCGDLFHQQVLRDGAIDALARVTHATVGLNMLVVVGVPVEVEGSLYNCAAILHRGKILGIVPKLYPPNYKNFQELRFFAAGGTATAKYVTVDGKRIPFGTDLLFPCSSIPGLVVGVLVCEDGWVVLPPSAFQTLAGATTILNLSASNDTLLKAAYRKQLFSTQSATYMGAYLYASCGAHESSTDMVFGGHMLICENGSVLSENERFEQETTLLVNEIDVERLITERIVTNSYSENKRIVNQMLAPEFRFDKWRRIEFKLNRMEKPFDLTRIIDGRPFVPRGDELLARCKEITSIQKAALKKRIQQVCDPAWQLYGYNPDFKPSPSNKALQKFRAVLGLSGGLDSTLTACVAIDVFDELGIPRKNLIFITMPGFGTTARTKNNAHSLMKLWGVNAKEIDIRQMCFEQMLRDAVNPFGIDLQKLQEEVEAAHKGVGLEELKKLIIEEFEERLRNLDAATRKKGDLRFENIQARMRTSILMDHGFVLGTGDLSELAKGWCTYNGDHMSMYNVNATIPKTLVKWLVAWMAHNRFEGDVRETLLDIVGTPISPELLPIGKDGKIEQKTEDAVGPYELTDFFIYNVIRFGFSPSKILYLAQNAKFEGTYEEKEFRRWLIDWFERFFRAQFKRSAVPDGPLVGSVGFSPRSNWRMPTDACAALWFSWLTPEEREERIAILTGARLARPAV